MTSDGPDPAHSTPAECAWCPLCRVAGLLRGDNAESAAAMAKVGAAATAFLEALRDLLEERPASTSPGEQPSSGPPSRVQRIDLETDTDDVSR